MCYTQKESPVHVSSVICSAFNDSVKDEDWNPLFDDGDPGQIVSTRYALMDLDLLSDYGLTYARFWSHYRVG